MALIRSAAEFANRHPLRAYDALHLASAALLRKDEESQGVMFASWDDALDRAAKREGFALLRASR